MAFTPFLVNTGQTHGGLEQEGFRWRNDDAAGESATWYEAQDTGINLPLDTDIRLRILVNAQSVDPGSKKYQLEFRRTVDSTWAAVADGTGKIQLSNTSNITAGGQDTTDQLTAPAGKTKGTDFTTGRMWGDENGADAIDIASNQYTELEWGIKASTSGGAAASDVYLFRVTAEDSSPALTRVDWANYFGNSAGDGTATVQLTTSGSNPCIVLFAGVDSTGDSTFTATHNGNSLGTVTKDGGTSALCGVWIATGVDIGTDLDVVFTHGIGSAFPTFMYAIAFDGVDQTTPNGSLDILSDGSNYTSLSTGTITCAAGNWILSFLGSPDTVPGTSLAVNGAGNTLVDSQGTGSNGDACGYAEDRDGADDTVDWSWTNSSRVTLMSFELKKAT